MGGGGAENQSVSGVTTICLTSPSHRVDQVVDCGLWNVGPLLFNGCAKLLDIGRNWNTLSYTYRTSVVSRASQTCSMGDMSGEYAGHARTGMFSASRNCVQILATWGRALSCCNMRWWLWMNGTTMGLRISSRYLCAFKMPSIKCTCVRCHTITPPHHGPLDPRRWHQHTTHPHHATHAICPEQWKPGFIREENTSPACQIPSNVTICPLKSVTTTNCSQVETPTRTTCMQMSFPETVSDSLCRNSLVMQTDCCSSSLGGWSQMILELNMLLNMLHVVTRGLRLSGRLGVLPNCLKRLWRRLMVEKWTFNSRGSQHANCTLPQNLQHLRHWAVW